MIKRRNKIIVAILFLFLILLPFATTTYARINNEYNNREVIETDLEGKMQNSIVLDAFAQMIYGLSSWLESLIGSAFQLLTGQNMFPWADRVIFNTVPFLDVNFLNPANHSLFADGNGVATPLAQIVKSVYSTVFTLAVAFLGVIVGLMTIKLAISSLAAEKAKYKEALMKFLFSLVMLFGMHYAMSFIFYINESMVEMASQILDDNLGEVQIPIDLNISNDIILNNFIEQNNAGEAIPQAIFFLLNPAMIIDFAYNNAANEELNEFLLDDTFIEQYKEEDGTPKGASNKALAGYLLSNSTYRKTRIPDAYGNNTGNIKFSDWFRWFDPSNKFELSSKKIVAYDVSVIQNKEQYDQIKKYYDDIKTVGDIKIVNNSIVSDEDVKKLQNTLYYKDMMSKRTILDDWGAAIEKTANALFGKGEEEIQKDKLAEYWTSTKKLADEYWYPLIQAHEIYVEGSIENTLTTKETLIANMGQFFKDSAWTYETNDDGTIKGWTPTKVTLSGAILYTMFIIQSIMFFFAYIKRFFYVVILAMLAPVIVIYDFLGKVAS